MERENLKPYPLFGALGRDKQREAAGFAGTLCTMEAMGVEAGKFRWDQSLKNLCAEAFGLYPAGVSLRQPDSCFRNQMCFNKDKDGTLAPECGMKWKSCYSHVMAKETEAQRLKHSLRTSQPGGRCDGASVPPTLPLIPGADRGGGRGGVGSRTGRSREQVHH